MRKEKQTQTARRNLESFQKKTPVFQNLKIFLIYLLMMQRRQNNAKCLLKIVYQSNVFYGNPFTIKPTLDICKALIIFQETRHIPYQQTRHSCDEILNDAFQPRQPYLSNLSPSLSLYLSLSLSIYLYIYLSIYLYLPLSISAGFYFIIYIHFYL